MVLTLLIALVEVVEAAAWHRAQEYRAQAKAAAEAAVLLREGGRPERHPLAGDGPEVPHRGHQAHYGP